MKRVRKQRNMKKITCEGDEGLETELKKRQRKTKKKVKLIDQCCIEQHAKNKTLTWGSQSVASDCLSITVENDLALETIRQKDWISPGYHNCLVDDKENNAGDVETKKDCANHMEGCITNVERKRVKSLHRLKIDKTENDQAIHGDLGGCDLMIASINRKVKKKSKKKTAFPKCGTSAYKEDNLVSSSIGSQIGLIHANQDGPKASAARVVSPYFQKISEKFQGDVERDESNCKGKLITSINRKVEKKSKKKIAFPKCGALADKEVNLVPSSIVSQKDSIHDNQNGPKTSAAKVVSPYFQKISEKFECDVERDESKCKGRLITSINRKVEKKSKKKYASPKCGTSADKEDGLVPLSIGSQKDSIHDNQDGPKTSAAKVVSPYFQSISENFECDVERDEYNRKGKKRRRLNRTTDIEFEELLSKCVYKCDNRINRKVDIGGREEEEDGSAGKSKRKDKKKRNKARSLTAAEKRAEAYQRKAPDCTWRPPRSPYNLLQEDHSYDPWRVLVICILLNITSGPQVKRVLSLFFDVFPNAEAAVDADELRIASLIQSLGLHRKRAAMIQRFSQEYLSDNWTHVTQLHGIGKYAADAYAMFCNGKWHQVTPNDHMLNYYWKFLQNRSLDFKEVAL